MIFSEGNIVKYDGKLGIIEWVDYLEDNTLRRINIRFFDNLDDRFDHSISWPESRGKLELVLEGHTDLISQANNRRDIYGAIEYYKKEYRDEQTMKTLYNCLGVKAGKFYFEEYSSLYNKLIDLIFNYLDFDMVSMWIDKHIVEDRKQLKEKAKNLIERISGSKVI